MAEFPRSPSTYDVHPSVAYVQAILANLKAKTGQTADEWSDRIHTEQPSDPKAWLRAKGLGSTQIGLVLQRALAKPGHAFDDTPEGYLAAAPGYVEAQYNGRKAALLPLFEHLASMARGLGADVKVCPCETMVPFYRNHGFAEVKPFVSRLDLGLALGDPATVKDPSGRLKDTGGFAKKDRITHKLEIASEADLKLALPWLKRAYERDKS